MQNRMAAETQRHPVRFPVRPRACPECRQKATLPSQRTGKLAFADLCDQPQNPVQIRLAGTIRPGNDVQVLQRKPDVSKRSISRYLQFFQRHFISENNRFRLCVRLHPEGVRKLQASVQEPLARTAAFIFAHAGSFRHSGLKVCVTCVTTTSSLCRWGFSE